MANKNTDYMKLMQEAWDAGNKQLAAQYEQMRNEKIAMMDVNGENEKGYTMTNQYSQYLNQPDSNSGYVPTNATTAPGVDYEAHKDEVDKQKEYLSQNPNVVQGADLNALMNQYSGAVNATLNGSGGSSAKGQYTQDLAFVERAKQLGYTVTPATYNGQEGWYYIEGKPREQQAGTSGADEDLLDDASYAIIQQLKAEYERCKAAGDTEGMKRAHAQAEAIRANYGYTGGGDGSQYITLGSTGHGTGLDFGEEEIRTRKPGTEGEEAGDEGGGDGSGPYDTSSLQDMLNAWKEAALKQSDGKIDFAVAQAIVELERALADAQPQFKEQAESIAKDEMQSLDNSALYAEARGDKGGIGQSQYNEIQAAAAQNRLAVQQAQTKLSTDTVRQIADLRAQGEFEKADAALEIAQTYLSKLIDIEMWAAEYDLSVAQFEASLEQWQKEYELAMKQFEESIRQWESEFGLESDLAYGQITGTLPSTGEMTLEAKQQLAAMGESMLSMGVMPSADQLAAMGITEAQAQQVITAQQLESAGNPGLAAGNPGLAADAKGEDQPVAWSDMTSDEVYRALFEAGYTNRIDVDSIKNFLMDMGIASGKAGSLANAYRATQYKILAEEANRLAEEIEQQNMAKFNQTAVKRLLLPKVSYALLDQLIEEEKIFAYTNPKTGKIEVSWAKGWNHLNYMLDNPYVVPDFSQLPDLDLNRTGGGSSNPTEVNKVQLIR